MLVIKLHILVVFRLKVFVIFLKKFEPGSVGFAISIKKEPARVLFYISGVRTYYFDS